MTVPAGTPLHYNLFTCPCQQNPELTLSLSVLLNPLQEFGIGAALNIVFLLMYLAVWKIDV